MTDNTGIVILPVSIVTASPALRFYDVLEKEVSFLMSSSQEERIIFIGRKCIRYSYKYIYLLTVCNVMKYIVFSLFTTLSAVLCGSTDDEHLSLIVLNACFSYNGSANRALSRSDFLSLWNPGRFSIFGDFGPEMSPFEVA